MKKFAFFVPQVRILSPIWQTVFVLGSHVFDLWLIVYRLAASTSFHYLVFCLFFLIKSQKTIIASCRHCKLVFFDSESWMIQTKVTRGVYVLYIYNHSFIIRDNLLNIFCCCKVMPNYPMISYHLYYRLS
jgi:hypothetical protein